MSTAIRLFIKPRTIPRLFPAGAAHLWMNTNYWHSVQQRRMFVIDDSGRSFLGGEAKTALEDGVFSLEDRIFSLEDHSGRVTKEIAEIKGDMRTMKWELNVVLAILLGGSGLMLFYFLKQPLDKRYEKGFSSGVNEQRPERVEAVNKSEMEEFIKELRNVLRQHGMQPTGSTKDKAQDS